MGWRSGRAVRGRLLVAAVFSVGAALLGAYIITRLNFLLFFESGTSVARLQVLLLVSRENALTIGVTPETRSAAGGLGSSGLAAVADRTDVDRFPAKLGPAMRPRHYGEVWSSVPNF